MALFWAEFALDRFLIAWEGLGKPNTLESENTQAPAPQSLRNSLLVSWEPVSSLSRLSLSTVSDYLDIYFSVNTF
jgi:hypothetical protein